MVATIPYCTHVLKAVAVTVTLDSLLGAEVLQQGNQDLRGLSCPPPPNPPSVAHSTTQHALQSLQYVMLRCKFVGSLHTLSACGGTLAVRHYPMFRCMNSTLT